MRITFGVVHWSNGDGIATLISGIIKGRGYEVIDFLHDDVLPSSVDIAFAYAPFGSLVPLARQLQGRLPGARPALALWLTEPLPNPYLPEWVRRCIGAVRSRGERLAYHRGLNGKWQPDPRLAWLTKRGFRYRYYGDLYWLRREGLLSVLAVTSQVNGDFLRTKGFDPVVAYIGSHSDWYADLQLERDISVLWLGKPVTKRRLNLLGRLREQLRDLGVEMHVVDGIENPYVFGYDRTVLLNRAIITLNLLREAYDDNSLRYFLSAPNRSLIVSEPTLAHTPFVPDVHLVEAPINHWAETICCYLANEQARAKIIEAAYQLSVDELSMERSVGKIVSRAIEAYCIGRQDNSQR